MTVLVKRALANVNLQALAPSDERTVNLMLEAFKVVEYHLMRSTLYATLPMYARRYASKQVTL